MLSRVAESIYWMSRYIERAEMSPVLSMSTSTLSWTYRWDTGTVGTLGRHDRG